MSASLDLNAAARAFSIWAEHELFQPAHREATALLDTAVDCHLIGLFLDLDWARYLATPVTARELSAQLKLEASSVVMLDAVLHRLASRHDFLLVTQFDGTADSATDTATVTSTGNATDNVTGDASSAVACAAANQPADTERRYQLRSHPADQRPALPELERRMAALGSDYPATLEFLAFGATHFMRSLQDDHEFMDRVLTGQEKAFAETWHRATNTDPLQDVHGIMGARAVALLFTGGAILEVGGGTGNGLHNNVAALREAGTLASLERYVFTDVSMPFILNTRKALGSNLQDVTVDWRLLNINKDFIAQRLQPDSMNLVYGVNAAHVAMDMTGFLQQCLQVLVPGGLVVFSERLRRPGESMAPREIVLNQSRYHCTAAVRHPGYRPAHAYLSRQHWLNALTAAGFKDAAVWPDVDSLEAYFPEQYAAVVVARA